MTESVVVQLVKAQADLEEARALLAAAWVGVPMRWRKVARGALFLAPNGKVWIVDDIEHPEGLSKRDVAVTISQPGKTKAYAREVHPDDEVNVLMPAVEADALRLVRDELGGDIVAPG